jgi:hypothetical protein
MQEKEIGAKQKYLVEFTVTYQTTIEKDPDETLEDALCDIYVPETNTVLYKENSFEIKSVKEKSIVPT